KPKPQGQIRAGSYANALKTQTQQKENNPNSMTEIIAILRQVQRDLTEVKEKITELDERITNLEYHNEEYYESMESEQIEEPKEKQPTHQKSQATQDNNIDDIKDRQTQLFASLDGMQGSMNQIIATIDTLAKIPSQPS